MACLEQNAISPPFALAAVQGKANYLAHISENRWLHDDYAAGDGDDAKVSKETAQRILRYAEA